MMLFLRLPNLQMGRQGPFQAKFVVVWQEWGLSVPWCQAFGVGAESNVVCSWHWCFCWREPPTGDVGRPGNFKQSGSNVGWAVAQLFIILLSMAALKGFIELLLLKWGFQNQFLNEELKIVSSSSFSAIPDLNRSPLCPAKWWYKQISLHKLLIHFYHL